MASSYTFIPPRSTGIVIGSVISSITLKVADLSIVEGKAFKVFRTNSCFKGSLFKIKLIAGIITPPPKFNENSLKYDAPSISRIKDPIETSNNWLLTSADFVFISLRVGDISFIWKGK